MIAAFLEIDWLARLKLRNENLSRYLKYKYKANGLFAIRIY